MDEDAFTKIPIVVVGARAKLPSESWAVSSQVFPKVTPWVIHADPDDCTTPWFVTWRQLVPVFPNPDTVSNEVEAKFALKLVVVASVKVAYREKSRSNVEEADTRNPTVVVGDRERSPVEFAALKERLSTNWVPQTIFPVEELYWRKVNESSHHPSPPW